MKAKTIKGKSINEIQSALEQCMAGGFKPTLHCRPGKPVKISTTTIAVA